MNATIDKGVLTITINTNKVPSPSASGKSLIVASSHGNQPTAIQVDGKPVIVSVNAYIKA